MNKDFALKIFDGFSIERWNDLVRPFSVVEMDKHAEKAVVAYIIAKYEENRGAKIDWEWMIYALFFELLRKIQLCDIKSTVLSLIRTEHPDEFRKLNNWALDNYKGLIDDADLFERFREYIETLNDPASQKRERLLTEKILKAAHRYSTLRELDMISCVNERERIDPIVLSLNADLQKYLDLRGIQLFITKQKPFEFLMRIEQLRFQMRWNRTPRIPETSVLGHCFFVAILTLILCRETGVAMCGKRFYGNFFSALFHDLPESVTRDIISPVKQATHDLPAVVKDIERAFVSEELVPLMESFYRDELLYFINREFTNRCIVDGQVREVTFEALNSEFNEGRFCPADGRLVRVADHYSALLEADISIRHGITSPQLAAGRESIIASYRASPPVSGIDVKSLFSAFES